VRLSAVCVAQDRRREHPAGCVVLLFSEIFSPSDVMRLPRKLECTRRGYQLGTFAGRCQQLAARQRDGVLERPEDQPFVVLGGAHA
jgi:hypothetical protein